MVALSVVLLVLFVIVSLLLIFLVAIQSEDDSGLGGVFGGSSSSTFGGKTNSVINKITAYLCVAFAVLAIMVAIVNKSTSEGNILAVADQQSSAAVAAQQAPATDGQ